MRRDVGRFEVYTGAYSEDLTSSDGSQRQAGFVTNDATAAGTRHDRGHVS
jgi:hypothetical protein